MGGNAGKLMVLTQILKKDWVNSIGWGLEQELCKLTVLAWLITSREYKIALLHNFLPYTRKETRECSVLFDNPSKISFLFLDLTIALSNPIKFFSLQEKRSVNLKDGSEVEVSFPKFCHCL